MPIKTRHTQRRCSVRRSFRTRPSNQTAVICVDHPDVQLFHDDSWDDDFALRSPAPRKPRKPRPVPEEIIEEDEEESDGVGDRNNDENMPPNTIDGNRSAIERMNAEFAEAEEYSLYIENEDGVRLKAIGNQLVEYDKYDGPKTTAHVFPKRNTPSPPDQAQIDLNNHLLRKAVWTYLRGCTPRRKRSEFDFLL
ncbi:unnamed protein product [Strongylus vulgaris]|uniref:Uncharacterized protein n=1 Tax=Strongylus vulgaris TaxID=40348 RepID=A0A3P7IDV9_STRVU|nr:unnamed protein product [Strongylus vulgaris]